MINLDKIYNEDCLLTMGRMPGNYIDLVVTSPPYDNLRVYNGQQDFDWRFIVERLFRVMKPGGVVVWVVGDATIKGSETGTSFRQALYFIQCGFKLHDTMIYKKNGTTHPAGKNSNRYSQTFEYMFVFSKGRPKTHNLIKDKPNKWAGYTSFGDSSFRLPDGKTIARKRKMVDKLGYRENVWQINSGKGYGSDNFASAHPAPFPEQLANDHIVTWSTEGDIVYDPLMGSGTTIISAIKNKRHYIGSDIDADYCKLTADRIKFYFKTNE